MRNKKTISVLLILALMLSFAGCSYEDLLKVKENTKLEIRYLGSFDVK